MTVSLPHRALLLAGLLWGLSATHAQTDPPAAAPPGGGLQFVLENDLFGKGKTDRWYTNGLRVSWRQRQPRQGEALTRMAFEVADVGLGDAVAEDAGGKRSIVWTLGQNMYTPRRIHIATPQRGDRPWAGWLYLGATAQGFRGDRFQQTDLKLGCTGGCSRADRLQRWVHDELDATYPAGWEQQIKSGAHVQLSHMQLWRRGDKQGRRASGDRFGIHGGFGATAGTLRTYATVMAGVVVGSLEGENPVFALSNDGDLVIQDFDESQALRRWLGFVNVSGTAVARNRFVTGATPYGRSEVELRRWVTAWQWGLSIPLDRWFDRTRLVFSQTSRTSEFSTPVMDRKEGVQRWGTLSLNMPL